MPFFVLFFILLLVGRLGIRGTQSHGIPLILSPRCLCAHLALQADCEGLGSMLATRPRDSNGNVDATRVESTFSLESRGRAAYMEIKP